MTKLLPNFVSGAWTVTQLRDSFRSALSADKNSASLLLFFYAITERGWVEVRRDIIKWQSASAGREVVVFVGTDHAITEPEALTKMRSDGARVHLLTQYQGIFHPKVLWLAGKRNNTIWVGSNNLTHDGLLRNIEFAVEINSPTAPRELLQWAQRVKLASEPLDDALLASYESERRTFGNARSNAGTFTWTKRKEPPAAAIPAIRRGDLIVEIMPQETGLDGKQIQLPKASLGFFGMAGRVGESRLLHLTPADGEGGRDLTMTVFANNSVRLSINELDYRARPCVVIFRRIRPNQFEFEIVQRSIFPTRYKDLLNLCTIQTRVGSRRWGLAK